MGGPIGARHLGMAVALIGLVLANLLHDVAMVWLMEEGYGSWWLNPFAVAILLGPVMLLGMWFGLGDGRWYVRLLVAIALTIAVALSFAVVGQLSANARRHHDSDNPWAMISFVLISMMLAASLLAFVLRRTRNWRLTWWPPASDSPTRQFQIGDILLWMVLISGSLAAFKFIVSIDADFKDQILEISLLTARTTLIALAAMLAAFGRRNYLRTAVMLVMAVLFVGLIFSASEVYQAVQTLRSGTRAVALTRYVRAATNKVMDHEVFAITAAFVIVVDCLVLRALGCQLCRPSKTNAISEGAGTDPPHIFKAATETAK